MKCSHITDGLICSVSGCRCAALCNGGMFYAPLCKSFLPDDIESIPHAAGISKQASWDDVKAKGDAILANGGVEIYRNDSQEVGAYVMSGVVEGMFPVSDGGPYEVILSKRSWNNSQNVGGWCQGFLCDCVWGSYHSGSPGHGGRWSGRFCSHAWATLKAANMRARGEFFGDRTASVDGGWHITERDGERIHMREYGNGCVGIIQSRRYWVLLDSVGNVVDEGREANLGDSKAACDYFASIRIAKKIISDVEFSPFDAKEKAMPKNAYNVDYAAINKMVEFGCDLYNAQFKTWQSLNDIQNDEDVQYYQYGLGMTDEDWQEGCRRIWEEISMAASRKRANSGWELYEQNITPELRHDILDPDEILDMYGAYCDESYRKVDASGMFGVVSHHVGMVDDWWTWDTYAGFYSYGIDCGMCDSKEQGIEMCEKSFVSPGFTVGAKRAQVEDEWEFDYPVADCAYKMLSDGVEFEIMKEHGRYEATVTWPDGSSVGSAQTGEEPFTMFDDAEEWCEDMHESQARFAKRASNGDWQKVLDQPNCELWSNQFDNYYAGDVYGDGSWYLYDATGQEVDSGEESNVDDAKAICEESYFVNHDAYLSASRKQVRGADGITEEIAGFDAYVRADYQNVELVLSDGTTVSLDCSPIGKSVYQLTGAAMGYSNLFGASKDSDEWYELQEAISYAMSGVAEWASMGYPPSDDFDMWASVRGAGRRLDYDDDIVIVRNPDGGIDYKGVFDYCPYKHDFDDGDFEFDGELYRCVSHPGYTLEVVAARKKTVAWRDMGDGTWYEDYELGMSGVIVEENGGYSWGAYDGDTEVGSGWVDDIDKAFSEVDAALVRHIDNMPLGFDQYGVPFDTPFEEYMLDSGYPMMAKRAAAPQHAKDIMSWIDGLELSDFKTTPTRGEDSYELERNGVGLYITCINYGLWQPRVYWPGAGIHEFYSDETFDNPYDALEELVNLVYEANYKYGKRAYTNPWGTESVDRQEVIAQLLQNEMVEITLDDPDEAPKSDDDEQWAFPYMGLHFGVVSNYDDWKVAFNVSCMVEEGVGFFQKSTEVCDVKISWPGGFESIDLGDEAVAAFDKLDRGGFGFWVSDKDESGYSDAFAEIVEDIDWSEIAANFIAERINYESIMNAASRKMADAAEIDISEFILNGETAYEGSLCDGKYWFEIYPDDGGWETRVTCDDPRDDEFAFGYGMTIEQSLQGAVNEMKDKGVVVTASYGWEFDGDGYCWIEFPDGSWAECRDQDNMGNYEREVADGRPWIWNAVTSNGEERTQGALDLEQAQSGAVDWLQWKGVYVASLKTALEWEWVSVPSGRAGIWRKDYGNGWEANIRENGSFGYQCMLYSDGHLISDWNVDDLDAAKDGCDETARGKGVFASRKFANFTSNGLYYDVAFDIDPSWSGYDKSVAEGQLATYGRIYTDEYGQPIDDEYAVDEAADDYDMLMRASRKTAEMVDLDNGMCADMEFDGNVWQWKLFFDSNIGNPVAHGSAQYYNDAYLAAGEASMKFAVKVANTHCIVYEVSDGNVNMDSVPVEDAVYTSVQAHDGWYVAKIDDDWGFREFGPYATYGEAVSFCDENGYAIATAGKVAYNYASFDADSKWRCHEEGFEGEYGLDELKELYESVVDKSEYPEFEDWEWDATRSGWLYRVGASSRGLGWDSTDDYVQQQYDEYYAGWESEGKQKYAPWHYGQCPRCGVSMNISDEYGICYQCAKDEWVDDCRYCKKPLNGGGIDGYCSEECRDKQLAPYTAGKNASCKVATRQFTYAEMQELEDEINGTELHNADRFKDGGAEYYGEI